MRLALEAGVATIRAGGGSAAGLMIAVDRVIVAGPRMQVALSIITQTGGHGDGFYPCCVDLGFFGLRLYYVPDGVAGGGDEVRKATREIFRAGGDWVKLATTGGGISLLNTPSLSPLARCGDAAA